MTVNKAQELIKGFTGLNALVVGDVMVDSYLWGRVERISPEAPVPVVRVNERSARLGGAANVALNLKALGVFPIVVTVLGEDLDADRCAALFHEHDLNAEGCIRTKERRTTVKTRVISGHQHIVRVDEEDDAPLTKSQEDALLERIDDLLSKHKMDVLIFEDYNKGVLTPRVIARTIELAKAKKIPTAVDPKKENFFAYQGVDLFKPNLKELREGSKIDLNGDDQAGLSKAVNELEHKLKNRISLVTLSEHGIYVHEGDEEHFIPSHQRSIADVSGAGDTVIAVAAACLAQNAELHWLAAIANLAGGSVCEHVGVVPIDKDELYKEAAQLKPPEK